MIETLNNDLLILNSSKLLKKLEKLKNDNLEFKFLRVCWVDISNKIRCKVLNIDWLLRNKPKIISVTISNISQSLPAFQDSITYDALTTNEFGSVYLIPNDNDSDEIVMLPYCKCHAQIFASLFKSDENGILKPWSLCPRNVLKESIVKLKNNHNLELKGSFEEEFYLIKKPISNNGLPSESIFEVDNHFDYNTFASFHSLDSYSDIIGPGQFEITVDYTDILNACDRHILIRQTIHSIASLNGYVATFLPKPYESLAGNGCHVHLSLWGNKEKQDVGNDNLIVNLTPNVNGVCGISKITEQFIGGVLKHSKSLTALFNTTINSFERLKPNCWSGCNISWGLDNKEAFVRIPSNQFSFEKGCSNFEIKTIDHTSNPYLAISGIIHSGIDGIENSIEPSKPTSSFIKPTCKNEDVELIPNSLLEAIDFFKDNSYLKSSLGNDISNAFIHVKLEEHKILNLLPIKKRNLKLLELY